MPCSTSIAMQTRSRKGLCGDNANAGREEDRGTYTTSNEIVLGETESAACKKRTKAGQPKEVSLQSKQNGCSRGVRKRVSYDVEHGWIILLSSDSSNSDNENVVLIGETSDVSEEDEVTSHVTRDGKRKNDVEQIPIDLSDESEAPCDSGFPLDDKHLDTCSSEESESFSDSGFDESDDESEFEDSDDEDCGNDDSDSDFIVELENSVDSMEPSSEYAEEDSEEEDCTSEGVSREIRNNRNKIRWSKAHPSKKRKMPDSKNQETIGNKSSCEKLKFIRKKTGMGFDGSSKERAGNKSLTSVKDLNGEGKTRELPFEHPSPEGRKGQAPIVSGSSSQYGEEDSEEDCTSEEVSRETRNDRNKGRCSKAHASKKREIPGSKNDEVIGNQNSSEKPKFCGKKSRMSSNGPLKERAGIEAQTSFAEKYLTDEGESHELPFEHPSPEGRKKQAPRVCNSEIPRHSVPPPHIHEAKSGGKRSRKMNFKQKRKDYDFCSMLVDSVLEKGSVVKEGRDEAVKQACAPTTSLPLKFRLVEIPKPPEKSEYEKLVDSLFAEMELALACEEIGSHCSNQVEDENENASGSDESHNQQARCSKGKHCLELDEEIGLRCTCCPHVELHAKEVMPLFAEKTYWKAESRRYIPEEYSMSGRLNYRSLRENSAGFCNTAKGTVWDLKPEIRETMYEHQKEGFEFLWKNLAGTVNLAAVNSPESLSNVGGCIISHAPGTGKTRLTIVFLETYLKLFPNSHPVIIAPASMLLTWEEEFRKWKVDFPFHNLNNPDLSGKKDEAAKKLLREGKCHNSDVVRLVKIYSWNSQRSVLGVSYSLYEKLAGKRTSKDETSKKRKRIAVDRFSENLRKVLLEKPGIVVLDEGHTPRSKSSNIWNTIEEIHTKKRIILSGTPSQNNFDELFNTLHLVRPEIAEALAREKVYAEMSTSRERHIRKGYREKGAISSSTSKDAIEKLQSVMQPFVHVHKGIILQQSLPGLRECMVLLNPPELQKRIIASLDVSQGTFEKDHKVALVSVHPSLLEYCTLTKREKIMISQQALEANRLDPNEGVKTRFIIELIRLSIAVKEKVLIFSQYSQPLNLIKIQLKEVFNWAEGKEILHVKGRTYQKQRQTMINVFNDPLSEAKVLLASTKCCSEGISLVGASRVILLDVVWNPSVERQAISRAYRIGQKKVVYTYHLMTSGTTEGDKFFRQAEKDHLSELVFSSSSNKIIQGKSHAALFEDIILEAMADHVNLKGMFKKISNQPKESILIEKFGVPAS